MKVDFLILFEHRVRELENACLLSTELKRRGYSTCISYYNNRRNFFIRPRVLVVPHLYNDIQVNEFALNKWKDTNAILDLQYEQVLSKNEEVGDDIHNPSGQAAFAQHIAWGKQQVKRYMNHGIEKSHIHCTGHMTMDMLKPRFKGFYLSKEYIANKYNIPSQSRWLLFISSFSYANMDKEKLDKMSRLYGDQYEFADFSKKSYLIIVDWLIKIAQENPDITVIYRPHPAERDCQDLKERISGHENIVIVNDYSVKQWIMVSDLIYTWYSTSIAEAYYASKNCQILRPVKVPPKLEVSIMEGSNKIENFQDFKKSVEVGENSFPLKDELLTEVYGSKDGYAYQKVADVCEKMLTDRTMQFVFQYKDQNESFLKFCFYWIFTEATKYIKIPFVHYLSKNPYYIMFRGMNIEQYHIGREIRQYEKRFLRLLNAI